MKKITFTFLIAALVLLAACSKNQPDAKPGTAAPDTAAVDYKKICERMIPLSPEARRGVFAQTCEKSYQTLLPACRNAAAVNECFGNMKTWDERLACMDSCVRNAEPGK